MGIKSKKNEIWQRSKKRVLLLTLLFFIIISVLILLDILNINRYIGLSSNYDWLAVIGSFIGSVFGGLISVIIMTTTIEYQKNSDSLDRHSQIAPYLSASFSEKITKIDLENQLDYIIYGEDGDHILSTQGVFIFENCGLGSMVEVCIGDIMYKNKLIPRAYRVVSECTSAVHQKQKFTVTVQIKLAMKKINWIRLHIISINTQ